MNVSGQDAYSIVYTQAPCVCLHITTTLVVMCRQIHILFHSFTSLFDATIYLQDPDQEVHAIEEEVVVEAGCIAKVAQALKDLLLLLYPPLVSRQMQSRRFLCMMIIWS